VTFNPNYMPWMTILGVLGAGIGYAVGPGGTGPEATLPAIYGLLFGCFAGIVLRVLLRRWTMKRAEQDEPTDAPSKEDQN
jgi:hypothetical protein